MFTKMGTWPFHSGLVSSNWSCTSSGCWHLNIGGEKNIPHPVVDHNFPLLIPIKITKIAGNETDPPNFVQTQISVHNWFCPEKFSPAISREFPVKWLLNPMLFRFWGLMFYYSYVFLAVIQCIYMIIHVYVYIYICIQYTVYSIL